MENQVLKLSVIIVSYNTAKLTLNCILSLLNFQKDDFEIIVVDNGSKDDSVELIKKNAPSVKIIENSQNKGFAAACNQAFQISKESGYYLFVNTDTVIDFNSIDEMTGFMNENPDCAAIGPKLLNQDGSMQNSFASYPSFLTEMISAKVMSLISKKKYPTKRTKITRPAFVDSLIGAFVMVRGSDLRKINGFDERYFFFLEETDMMRRLRKSGKNIVFHPSLEIVHLQGASANKNPLWSRHYFFRSRYQFLLKWEGVIKFSVIYMKYFVWYHVKTFFYLFFSIMTLFQNASLVKRFFIALHLTKNHYSGFPPFTKNIKLRILSSEIGVFNCLEKNKKMIKNSKLFDELITLYANKDKMSLFTHHVSLNGEEGTVVFAHKNKTKKAFLNYLKAESVLIAVPEVFGFGRFKRGVWKSIYFLLTEKSDMNSLKEIMNDDMALIFFDDSSQRELLFEEIALSLSDMHKKNVCYRNISLGDFLVGVKVIDGEAKLSGMVFNNLFKLRFGFFATLFNRGRNLKNILRELQKYFKMTENEMNGFLKTYNNNYELI